MSLKLLVASPSERKHIEDLKALAPTNRELNLAKKFVLTFDSSTPGARILKPLYLSLRRNMSRRSKITAIAVEDAIERCLVTLGLPLGVEPIHERKEGLVDPEALVVLTLSELTSARLCKLLGS